MNDQIDWLTTGDPAIQFQTKRDLLHQYDQAIQQQILKSGWGRKFLDCRNDKGGWGKRFYEPKWISTHYTLLDIRNLEPDPHHNTIQEIIKEILDNEKAPDGGINPIGMTRQSDVCVNGMFLNYAAYFNAREQALQSVIDFLLEEWMPDGGFNCHSNRSGARHSSMHSTISVLEGFFMYQERKYTYRTEEVVEAYRKSIEFLLIHQLFLSDRNGQIIHKDFLRLSYPGRWKYDILRALDFFQLARWPGDERLIPALKVLTKKRRRDGRWNVQAKYPGQVHFEMEKAGQPSRWNTLRALRVLEQYGSLMSS